MSRVNGTVRPVRLISNQEVSWWVAGSGLVRRVNDIVEGTSVDAFLVEAEVF